MERNLIGECVAGLSDQGEPYVAISQHDRE